jgi:hypothetical protein
VDRQAHWTCPDPRWHSRVKYPSRAACGFHDVGAMAGRVRLSSVGFTKQFAFSTANGRAKRPVDRPRDNQGAYTIHK